MDKVDRLVNALLDLSGLSVTNVQAAEIQSLYSELLDFDKRPLTFPLSQQGESLPRQSDTELVMWELKQLKRYQYLIPQMHSNVK